MYISVRADIHPHSNHKTGTSFDASDSDPFRPLPSSSDSESEDGGVVCTGVKPAALSSRKSEASSSKKNCNGIKQNLRREQRNAKRAAGNRADLKKKKRQLENNKLRHFPNHSDL